MATTSRALAFAARWFDEATFHRVFEPLIADWQREWQEASGIARSWVSVRAVTAFLCAVVVSVPRTLRQPTPSTVTARIVIRVTRFTLIAGAILLIPFAREFNALEWSVKLQLFLMLIPSTLALVFPFAMVTAVDAIRRDHALPAPVERSTVVKLAVVAVLFMVALTGFIFPASNQAFRVTSFRASMTQGSADAQLMRQRLPRQFWTNGPARGLRELTIYELVTDPALHADEARTNPWSHGATVRREVSSRASLSLLPVFVLWLRWRVLDLPRRRWLPLPPTVVALAAYFCYFVLRSSDRVVEDVLALSPGMGAWAPLGILLVLMGLQQSRRRKREETLV